MSKTTMIQHTGEGGEAKMSWYKARMSGNGQGLVVEADTGRDVAVTYDEKDAALVAAAPDLLALAARGASLADAVAESAYDVGKHTEDIRRLAYWALDARYAIRAAEGEV